MATRHPLNFRPPRGRPAARGRARPGALASALVVAVLAGCVDREPLAPEDGDRETTTAEAPRGPQAVQAPGQYIVRFRDDVPDARGLAGQLEAAHGLRIRHRYSGALKGFSAVIPEAALPALRRHPLILSIEPNWVVQLQAAAAPVPVPAAGLRVRLVADDLAGLVADGGTVATWPNLGSEGDAAQGSASRRPTFHAGSPGGPFGSRAHVGFNEGSDNDEALEILGVSPHGSGTLIAVFQQEDAAKKNYGLFGMWGSSTNRGGMGTYRKEGQHPLHYWDRTSGWRNSTFTPSAGADYVAVWRVEGSVGIDFQVNGTAHGSASMSSDIHQPFDRYVVGSSEPSTSSVFDGQVAELLFWDRKLSDCERDQVVADLGTQYGVPVGVSGGGSCTPPADPSGLGATATGSSTIALAWTDNSTDEDGFAVERRETGGSFAEIAQVGTDVSSYADGGRQPATGYCYRVRAFNGNGSSGYTAEACATTEALPPPPEPVPVPTAGLRVRLVADDLSGPVADGGTVGMWLNRGSDADAAQGNASRRPTFHAGTAGGPFGGRGHVGFNEGSDNDEVLEVPGVSPHGSGTLIAVFRQEDLAAHNYGLFATWGSSTNRGGMGTYRKDGAHPLHYWDRTSGWKNSTFTPSAGTDYVAVWRVEGSVAVDFQVDGAARGSAPMSSDIHQPFDRYLIGASEPSTSSRFDGQVAELLFWDRKLSDCERDQVVADLGARYGVAVGVSGGGSCTPPADPSGLGATATGSSTIALAWTDHSTDEDGFAIERAGAGGSFAAVAQVGADVTSYADGGLQPATGYCYRVRAFNGNGSSGYTAEACATTDAGPPPPDAVAVPTAGLRVRLVGDDLTGLVGDGSGVATWPNRGSEGDAAQGSASRLPAFHAGSSGGPFGGRAYVGFNEGADDDEVLEVPGVAPHGSATLIAVFRQEDATNHNYGFFGFWGSSTDRGGFGTYRSASPNPLHYWDRTSDWKNSTFTVTPVVDYVAVWRVEGSVGIDFQVNGADQGSQPMPADIHQPYDRYTIGASEPSTSSVFDGQVAEVILWDRPLLDCERDQVVAGLGARYGIPVAVAGAECVPPSSPSNLQASATSAQVVDLAWTDGSTNETGFAIERRAGADAFVEIARVGQDVTTYSDAGLIPETQYCYRVRAFNGDGSSGWTGEACTTTPAAAPGECADTGGHDGLAELWNISKIKADRNIHWKANRRPGCEIRAWYFGLDSGVDSDHPDLDVAEVRNFVSAEPGNSGEDGNGHGTHTAGSAAARDGNGGVVGVAPGGRVYGFRVCRDDGSCSYDDIIAGVEEVRARRLASPSQPMVANLSLAGPTSDIMDTAIRRAANAGVVIAMAAGNGVFGACLIPDDAAAYSPARTGDDAINGSDGSDGNTRRVNGAITVTSSNSSDADVNCNYGNPVTVAAPGLGIKSTWLNGGYNTISGTSMATPHVAGAAMLYLQSRPDATPTEVEQAIVNRLDPWTTDEQPNASGRLDAETL